MFEITIDVVNYFGKKEIFTLSDEGKSGLIIHEQGNYKETDEVDRKTISKENFENITKAFSGINFIEVFNEHSNLIGADGSILTCTIQNGSSKITTELICPQKDSSMPETTKLLEACELICPVLELDS